MKNNKRILLLLTIVIIISSVYILYKNNIAVKAYKSEDLDITSIGKTASLIEKKQVHIKIGDDVLNTFTMFNTVKESLESLNIEVDEDDRVTPALYEIIDDNEEIEIVRVEKETVVQKDSIPFSVITKINKNLDIGQVKTIRNGKDGLRNTEKLLTYENGELISESLIDEKIINEPVNKIVEKGSRDYFISSRGKTSFNRSLVMVATAYDLSYESTGKTPGHDEFGITASGTRVRPGVVAVDPSVIPLGTKLYIQGYGFAVAEDTGGAIKGNRIDLFMENRKEALDFGRKNVKVYILK